MLPKMETLKTKHNYNSPKAPKKNRDLVKVFIIFVKQLLLLLVLKSLLKKSFILLLHSYTATSWCIYSLTFKKRHTHII